MINMTILLEGLAELASEDLQRRLWLHGNENQMSSFTEAICGVFDDAGLTKAMESRYLDKNFSRELCQKVERLDQLINLIPEDCAPKDIIEHPKMAAVRALSNDLLDLFMFELRR